MEGVEGVSGGAGACWAGSEGTSCLLSCSPVVCKPSHTPYSLSPVVCKPSHTLYSLSPVVCKPSHTLYSLFPVVCKPSHTLYSLSPSICKPSHTLYSLSPVVCKPSHTLYSLSPSICKPSHTLYSLSPVVCKPPHTPYSLSPVVCKASHTPYYLSPFCSPSDTLLYSPSFPPFLYCLQTNHTLFWHVKPLTVTRLWKCQAVLLHCKRPDQSRYSCLLMWIYVMHPLSNRTSELTATLLWYKGSNCNPTHSTAWVVMLFLKNQL